MYTTYIYIYIIVSLSLSLSISLSLYTFILSCVFCLVSSRSAAQHRAQSTELRAQSTELRAQSTEHRSQNTEQHSKASRLVSSRLTSPCFASSRLVTSVSVSQRVILASYSRPVMSRRVRSDQVTIYCNLA